jgi:tetratricopeptide (TPR) repeat protein
MSLEKNTPRQNRLREALEKIYDQTPPQFAEYLRRFREDPKSRVFAPLAEAYRRMGKVEEAIQICKEGLLHHPDFHGGRVALAKCYLDKKRYAEAKEELERVILTAPENLMAQKLLGDTFLMLHQRKDALHSYKMALLLAPQDVALSEKVYALEKSIASFTEGADLMAEFENPVTAPPEATVSAAHANDEKAQASVYADPLDSIEQADINQVFSGTGLTLEEEPAGDPVVESRINQILGFSEEDESQSESFHVESVAQVFGEEPVRNQEITTETLGDLYYSQGQFDKALRIFEKIQRSRPTPLIGRKVEAARAKLGVDRVSIVRSKKIAVLKSLLQRVHTS